MTGYTPIAGAPPLKSRRDYFNPEILSEGEIPSEVVRSITNDAASLTSINTNLSNNTYRTDSTDTSYQPIIKMNRIDYFTPPEMLPESYKNVTSPNGNFEYSDVFNPSSPFNANNPYYQSYEGGNISEITGRPDIDLGIFRGMTTEEKELQPLQDFKFPSPAEPTLNSNFKPQENILKAQPKIKQPTIEEMKPEISEEQELINKELADKQAEELRQLRKERNSAYRDIRDNKEKISNVLQKKILTYKSSWINIMKHWIHWLVLILVIKRS
jgi:hypothetical protein